MNSEKNRLLTITIVVVVLLFSLLHLSAISSYWKITPDSATYVLAGKSLAAGEGYREMGKPVPLYPPVTSFVFSIFILFFPDSYFALNAVVTISVLLSLFLCFFLFKKNIGKIKSLIIVQLSMGSIFLFQQSTFLLSDALYMFFSILTLIVARGIYKRKGSWLDCILLGAIVLVVCMTRIVGLSLVLAIAIYSLVSVIQKRTKIKPDLVLMLLVVTICVLLWEYRSFQLGVSHFKLIFQNEAWVDESGYISLVVLIKRLFMNLGDYAFIGSILTNQVFEKFPMIHTNIKLFVYLCSVLLFCFGLFVAMRRTFTLINIYVIVYLLVLGPLGLYITKRWFVPILPFLFYYVLLGLEYGIEKTRNVIGPIVPKIIHASLIIYIMCYLGTGLTHMLKVIPEEHKSPFGSFPIKRLYYYDTQRLAMWLGENSSPSDSYVCQHPIIWDVVTERKGYSFPFSRDQSKLLDLLKTKKIRYVLVDKKKEKVREFLLPVIHAYPNRFKLIKDEKEASLYEFYL